MASINDPNELVRVVDTSGWNQGSLMTAAGTVTFPSMSAAVAEEPKFCNYCGHPLVSGKITGREYSSTSGLMVGRWSMLGCETKRWLLYQPRLVNLMLKLRMLSPHTMNVLAERFDEENEEWEHWSNVTLKHWFRYKGQQTW